MVMSVAIWSQDTVTTEGKQLNIPGTKVFITPPSGFQISSSFSGLVNNEVGTIQIMDLDGGSFDSNAAKFTKQALEKGGLTILEYKDFKHEGFDAKWVYMTKDIKSMALVFGDDSFSVLAMALMNTNDEKVINEIKAGLLSITYQKELKVDSFQNLLFELDDSQTALKFAKKAGPVWLYSKQGKLENIGGDHPMVMVMTIPISGSTNPKSAVTSVLSSLEGKGWSDAKVLSESTDPVNGLEGYTTVLQGKMKGSDVLFFAESVKVGATFVLVQGFSRKDFKEDLILFQELAKTIKAK